MIIILCYKDTCKYNWFIICILNHVKGIGKLATGDGKHLADPEVLRRLTSSVSCALDEAAAALTRMRSENPRPQPETR